MHAQDVRMYTIGFACSEVADPQRQMSAGMAIHKHTLTITFLPGTMEVEALALSDLDLDLAAVQRAAGMSSSGSLAYVVSPPHDCSLSHQSCIMGFLHHSASDKRVHQSVDHSRTWACWHVQELDCNAAASSKSYHHDTKHMKRS